MRMVAESNVVQTTPIVAISMKRSRVSVRYEPEHVISPQHVVSGWMLTTSVRYVGWADFIRVGTFVTATREGDVIVSLSHG